MNNDTFNDLVFDSEYEEVEIPVLVQVMNELQIPFVKVEEIIETESGITVFVKIKKENKNGGIADAANKTNESSKGFKFTIGR